MADASNNPDGLRKLFEASAPVLNMATGEAATRLAEHASMCARHGLLTAAGVRIKDSGGKFHGLVFVVCGSQVSESDVDAFVVSANGLMADVDPKGANPLFTTKTQ